MLLYVVKRMYTVQEAHVAGVLLFYYILRFVC